MRIAIYGSRRQHKAAEYIRDFLAMLSAAGISVVMHRKLYSHLYELIPRSLATVATVVDGDDFGADMAVSLGGDGTFLRTAVWVGDKGIPIIGVNTGHLGFLTTLPVERLCELLSALQNDSLRLERRHMLSVRSCLPDSRMVPYALNEVAVAKVETASMIEARVEIDGLHMADYRADGIIVATATGSTAYNLSVGGPIVQPTVDVNVVTPVAAHSLSMRPMVVSGSSVLSITAGGRASHVRLSLDGRSCLLDTGCRIEIARAPFDTLVLLDARRTFADILRDKLHWGES